jgi:hypothetical protein
MLHRRSSMAGWVGAERISFVAFAESLPRVGEVNQARRLRRRRINFA